MQDLHVGNAFRAVRLRRHRCQLDVAKAAGVSHSLISLIERGHLDRLPLGQLRRIASVLDIRVDVVPRWRGGELERLINAGHSALHEKVAQYLAELGGWEIAPEVSFAIYGERGIIDILAWHAASLTLLVIEFKTEIVDVQATLGTFDRKIRLPPGSRGSEAGVLGPWRAGCSWPTARRTAVASPPIERCFARPCHWMADRCEAGSADRSGRSELCRCGQSHARVALDRVSRPRSGWAGRIEPWLSVDRGRGGRGRGATGASDGQQSLQGYVQCRPTRFRPTDMARRHSQWRTAM